MILIKKEFFTKLAEHSQREFPNEACGILAGRGQRVEKVYAMINADKSPESFFMDAQEQLKVSKEIRGLGLEMIGIYHSHVSSQAYPSAHDLALAFYPEVSYCIVTLKDRHKPHLRSFKIRDGKITEEEVIIENE